MTAAATRSLARALLVLCAASLASSLYAAPLIKPVDEKNVASRIADSFNTGKQLCNGNSPGTINEKVVALMMLGQPFKSKNFATQERRSCDSLSMEAQRMLANNHIANMIQPLEADGFRVDVFLAETDCLASRGGGRPFLTEWLPNNSAEEVRARFSKELTNMYGAHRVVRTVSMDVRRNQFFHVGQMMEDVGNYTVDRGIGYRFSIALRFDVKLLFNLADMFKNDVINESTSSSPGLDLNSFVAGDDIMFMFPGGLTNCMNQLFNECLAPCKDMNCTLDENKRESKVISDTWERNPKCYEFGPLVLNAYVPRDGGYVNALSAFKEALSKLSPGYAGSAHGGSMYIWKDGAEQCQAWCGAEQERGTIDKYYPAYQTVGSGK